MTWRPRAALLVDAGLALLVLALFFHATLLGETWITRDALAMHQPWRGHVLESLRAGHVPEWWDAVGMGTPVAGNPLFGVTYPLMWAMAPLPPPLGVDVFFALHVWIGAIGVARFSRRLGATALGAFVGGASFAAGGWATSMVVMGIPLLTAAWLPHVAAAADEIIVEKRGHLRFAAMTALLLMAGDPAVMVTALLLVVMLVGARGRWRALAPLALAGAAAVAMAAVTLATATAYLADSERAAGLTTAGASVWSHHPLRIVEWIWPGFLGDPVDARHHLARLVADEGSRAMLTPSFSLNVYVGLPVLVLAAAGAHERRLRWLLGLATAVFVLLALGEHTPLYAVWRFVFPPERILRYPERHLVGALVVWSAFAGAGLGRVRARTAAVAAAILTALVAGAWLARGPLATYLSGLRPAMPLPVDVDGALHDVFTKGATAALCAWIFVAVVASRRLAALTPLVVLGPLAAATMSVLPTLSRHVLLTMPAWLDAPLADARATHAAGAPVTRVYRDTIVAHVFGVFDAEEVTVTAHESLADHLGPIFGLGDMPGYHPTAPRRHSELWERATGPSFERLCDLFDVGYALLAEGDPRGASLELAAEAPVPYGLYRNPSRRPRGFVAPRWSFVDNPAAARSALFAAGLDFHAVRLEGSGPPSPAGDAALAPCEVESRVPERVTQRCRGAGYAVLLDAWSPGWSALVDGQPAPILRADALARAVAVTLPGDHLIEWRYRTPSLRAGAVVSLAAWLVWAVLAMLKYRTCASAGSASSPPSRATSSASPPSSRS